MGFHDNQCLCDLTDSFVFVNGQLVVWGGQKKPDYTGCYDEKPGPCVPSGTPGGGVYTP